MARLSILSTLHRLPLLLSLSLLILAPLNTSAAPCGGEEPRRGAVASEQEPCSKIGADLIAAGGNAADAMVGTVFCVGTMDMYHSGIGGGGFMLVRSSQGEYEFIDFREKAPAAAFKDMYNSNYSASLYGGLASGVPGELRGLEYLHTHYGVLPWADVLAPAIKIARYGFTVDADMMNVLDNELDSTSFLVDDPAWAIDFAPNGTLIKLGDHMTRKRYADTLETIASEGAHAFYTGAIAKATIAAIQAANGTMTMEDLRNYSVAIREPVHIMYRGHKLTSTNAPSSGVVTLSALNAFGGYEPFGQHGSVNLSTHLLDETLRFAYGERTQLGDPYYNKGLDAYTQKMVSDETARDIRSKISDTRTFNVSYYDPKGLQSLNDHGTSHVVTADDSGMAVSLTTTVNVYFGSQVIVPETGVIMNDEMNDFSIPDTSNTFGYIASPSNYIEPGKRPQSSISPIIGETPDGKLFFATGAAGGSEIITATTLNTVHVVDQGMSMADALKQPRFHDQLEPDVIEFEYAFNNETVAYMKSLGCNVTWVAPGSSTAQGLKVLPGGIFEAAGEPRQADSGGAVV